MIQRKQTIFLLLAAIVAVVCFVLRLEWIDVLQLATAGVAAVTIFLYRKRLLQARLCVVAIILILAWYVGIAALKGSVEMVDALPMVEAIFLVLARKGIISDEKLVRAADRIR